VVPVHVDTPIGPSAEQVFIADLNRARDVIDKVKEIPAVSELIERLSDPSDEVKADVERQLTTEFEAALHEEGFQPRLQSSLAALLAHTTVNAITVLAVKSGDSIIIYFLCKTVRSLYELRDMISSHFIRQVFVAIIEAVHDTDVDVYYKSDDFDCALQCVSGPPDTGL